MLAALVWAAVPGFAQSQPTSPAAAGSPALPSLAAPAGAAAATEETYKLDNFVVTGIRRGIEASIATKREAVSIVESISAEDIGKLPDVSIAESIVRLPGLAAQRVDGRAQTISVRGLAPDFANTLLNGREQVSTGDNRGVEFDQYPSELINRVTIFKTPDAALVGQGLSGTLNLQTVRPLSLDGRKVALNARGSRNSLNDLGADSKDSGSRFSAAYIDQFLDHTLGVAVGYARMKSPIAVQESGTYGWNTATRPGVPAGTQVTGGLKSFIRSGTNTRDGLFGIVEWRPNPHFTSVIDAYYSEFKRVQTKRGLETRLDQNGGNSPAFTYTATTIEDNVLLGGTVANVYPAVRGMYSDRKDKLTALGWNGEYRAGKWVVTGDLSYSRAERDELNLETQASLRTDANKAILDTITYDLRGGGFPAVKFALGQDYGDPTKVKIGPTIFRAGFGKVPSVEDKLYSYKLVASRSLGKFFDNVSFGFNYADREKHKLQPEARLGELVTGQFQPLASSVLLDNANLGLPSVVAWNVPAALGTNFQPFTPGDGTSGAGASPGFAAALVQKRWSVDEQIGTFLTQFNLNAELGGVHLRGNIGAQLQDVDQSSTADFLDRTEPAGPAQIKTRTDGRSYTEFLPSANLVFDLGRGHVVRAAAARQVARPRLDQLRGALDFNVNATDGAPSGSGGNPRLSPWIANALDLSYEKYFAAKGYIAVAGFYKDLKSYIFDLTTEDFDFSEFTKDDPLATTNIGRFRQPLNGKGGTLKGLEGTLSVPFSMVADALDGFGFVGSISRTSSGIAIDNTNLGSNVRLPGLSKTVTSLTFYYEKRGFSARVNHRWRSAFVGEITGFAATREFRFVAAEAVVDAQVGYTFGTGALKGLELRLQASNLTNKSVRTFQNTTAQIVEYDKFGRDFLFGANYRF